MRSHLKTLCFAEPNMNILLGTLALILYLIVIQTSLTG